MCSNIAIIDPTSNLYPLLLNMEGVDVTLLYVNSEEDKNKIRLEHSNINIYCGIDATQWKQSFVSRDEITKWAHIQLKVERFLERFHVNPSYAMSQYYHALAFWLYQFRNISFDCIIIGGGAEHGCPMDTIPLDLAKEFEIPAFMFESHYATHDRFKSIRCINTNKHVNLVKLGAKPIDIHTIVSPEVYCDDKHVFDTILSSNKPKYLKNTVVSFVNLVALIVAKFRRMLKKKTCMYALKMTILDRLYFIYSLLLSLKKIWGKEEEVNALSMTVENPNTKLLSNLFVLKYLKRYYRRHALKDIPKNQNCIIYALHYEPEASIMNRSVYNSQIYNLEMLSSCLPKNWKIYVKEHPHQYYSAPLDPSYIKQSPHYKSKCFYQKIMDIENVEFLDDRIPSSKLLNKEKYPNVRAFATINGTISIECMLQNTPIIIFDSPSTLYQYMPEIHTINNYSDLKELVNQINSGTVGAEYTTLERIVPQYLVRETTSKGDNCELELPKEVLYNLIKQARNYISPN